MNVGFIRLPSSGCVETVGRSPKRSKCQGSRECVDVGRGRVGGISTSVGKGVRGRTVSNSLYKGKSGRAGMEPEGRVVEER